MDGSLAALKDWLTVLALGAAPVMAVALLWLRSQFVPLVTHQALVAKLDEQRKEHDAEIADLKEAIDQKQPSQEAKAALAKIELIDDRVLRVESDLKHFPDRDTTHRLEMSVARLEGRLETMTEQLKPVAAMAARMQDYLLEGAKK